VDVDVLVGFGLRRLGSGELGGEVTEGADMLVWGRREGTAREVRETRWRWQNL